jgi:hypothetical protein
MEWANSYDTGGMDIRSKTSHAAWMKKLKCKSAKINEVLSVEDEVKLVLDLIK